MRSVYGPVLSWRFGLSLGIDATMLPKKCSFDCIYCQLGRTKIYVSRPTRIEGMTTPERLREDLEAYKPKDFDVITFSGTGEPTANPRILELIDVVREFYKKPIYMLTNATFLSLDRLLEGLAKRLDLLSAKLDARDQRSYEEINRPVRPKDFDTFLEGHRKAAKAFEEYGSKYTIQIMVTSLTDRKKLIEKAYFLEPDAVYVTVPYRRFSELMPKDLEAIREFCESFYECYVFKPRSSRGYISEEAIQDLVSRRPMRVKELAEALGISEERLREILESMKRFGKIKIEGDLVRGLRALLRFSSLAVL